MRFCVTVSRGLNPFVMRQLLGHSLEADAISEGKIIFHSESAAVAQNLKCAERLFLLICSEVYAKTALNKRELFDFLFEKCRPELVASAFEEAHSLLRLPERLHDYSFRVSLKVSGKWKHKIDIQKLSAAIARRLRRCLRCSCVLRNATFELCVHITEKSLFIGVPLNLLSKRSYLYNNALRCTVVDAMIQLANITGPMFVIDLTCGSSSILIQAAHSFSNQCCFLGMDLDESALETSLANKRYLEAFNAKDYLIDFVAADINADFFCFNAVDRIISDLPFGLQYGNGGSAMKVLKRVVSIFSRCRIDCLAVLLISAAHLDVLTDSLSYPSRLLEKYEVALGNTQAVLVSLANDAGSTLHSF